MPGGKLYVQVGTARHCLGVSLEPSFQYTLVFLRCKLTSFLSAEVIVLQTVDMNIFFNVFVS